jgi:GDP-4-dehydro-6-deoxy-D-mannose reductase
MSHLTSARPALVTGAAGFAGGHLLQHLLRFEPAVSAWTNPSGQRPARDDARVAWRAVDLLDRDAVFEAIAKGPPSTIYHCAGVADVGGSWANPERALRVNVLGTHHLLEAVSLAGLDCPVLVTGSALIYRPSSEPIAESFPIGPTGPYGVSKLAQEMLALRSAVDRVIVTRSFNHAGPGQSDAYVASSFARQIAGIEAGLAPPVLRVGNLDSRRDITDVRDVVRAYRLLALHGASRRPYNVCSGHAVRIGDLLEMLLGMSRVTIAVESDPARMRPSDNPVVAGDPSRISAETGWRPEIPIEQSLSDLLDYWRARVGAARPH